MGKAVVVRKRWYWAEPGEPQSEKKTEREPYRFPEIILTQVRSSDYTTKGAKN